MMKLEKCLHYDTCKCSPLTMCGKRWSETGCMVEVTMSNSDYMRSLNNEELGKWLCNLTHCDKCIAHDLCKFDGGKANGLINWLKQPYRGR